MPQFMLDPNAYAAAIMHNLTSAAHGATTTPGQATAPIVQETASISVPTVSNVANEAAISVATSELPSMTAEVEETFVNSAAATTERLDHSLEEPSAIGIVNDDGSVTESSSINIQPVAHSKPKSIWIWIVFSVTMGALAHCVRPGAACEQAVSHAINDKELVLKQVFTNPETETEKEFNLRAFNDAIEQVRGFHPDWPWSPGTPCFAFVQSDGAAFRRSTRFNWRNMPTTLDSLLLKRVSNTQQYNKFLVLLIQSGSQSGNQNLTTFPTCCLFNFSFFRSSTSGN
jgi:hypothetical protein